ncbi:MAG: class I tRNA ligase family protein, partial [Oscillospiraceae bacterium]|nr:class I tRNA ligase family protein [Oscillospiraceae bacterium]
PFHTVLIHGLVRDSQGRKMSKSLGNGIDPLDMVEKYGADALRFNLVTGNSPGNDMRFYEEKCEAMRNFCNKIWNASRFVMMNLTVTDDALPEQLELEDKWILSRFNDTVRAVGENLEKFELGVAAGKIYDFIWDNYCDWYIELSKPRLQAGDEDVQHVLLYVLTEILKLLHPFMPFITEEIYDALPHNEEALIIAKFPEFSDKLSFPTEERDFEMVMESISAIRSRRAEMNVPPSKKAKVIVSTAYPEAFKGTEMYFERLASASEVDIFGADAEIGGDGYVVINSAFAKMALPMAELVDLDKERARIEQELKKNRGFLENQERKLANESFVSRAPEAVVQAERDRADKLRALIKNLEETLAGLK